MRRAFTLAEVLVASAIFVLLGLMGWALMTVAARAGHDLDSQSEAFRQGSLALSRSREELRGARLVSPLSGLSSSLEFRYPRVEGRRLVVDAEGRPDYTQQAKISQAGDQLLLEKPVGSPPRLLARLGAGGFAVARQGPMTVIQVNTTSPDGSTFEGKFELYLRPF
ncbi:MAG: prepilin-type N-terminal cleavage/methylation domain-containing protein [Candidatus Eremiobacteraeota bacterium]|nr:prepilin-type N-terminal cleavage/methylation domain-containing protein [Candidatus Eremiobacteraeota bacterium]